MGGWMDGWVDGKAILMIAYTVSLTAIKNISFLLYFSSKQSGYVDFQDQSYSNFKLDLEEN